jgi:hypothetical protein
LFQDGEHIVLMESFWDAEIRATTQRFLIVDAGSGAVARHAMTTQAYADEGWGDQLEQLGFMDVQLHPSLVGHEVDDVSQAANLVVVGRKRSLSNPVGA